MSPITPPCTVTRAPRPIVTWSASPAWPARKTSSSTWVLPAIPAWPVPHFLPEPHPPPEPRVGPDRPRLLPGDACADPRRRVDPGLPSGLGEEPGDARQQRDVRIAHDDAAGGPTPAVVRHEVRLAEHDCRPRLLKILEIALRSKKREIVGAGPIERRDARDR